MKKSSFFLINVILIVFMITTLFFPAFAVDSSAVADRLSVCLTLLLTAVAFKFVVSGSLQPMPYLHFLINVCGAVWFLFS